MGTEWELLCVWPGPQCALFLGHGISSHGRRGRGGYPSHNDIFTVKVLTFCFVFRWNVCATQMTSELLRSFNFCKNIMVALHAPPYSAGKAISKHSFCMTRIPQGSQLPICCKPRPQAVPTQFPLSAHSVLTQFPHSSHWYFVCCSKRVKTC